MWSRSKNWVFKNTLVLYIPLFESPRNLYCPDGWISGWVDGWVDAWMGGWVGGNQKDPSILLIFKYVNEKKVLILNMGSKLAYGLCIKSYEYFK